MEGQIKAYIDQFPVEIVDLFQELRQLIFESGSNDMAEIMWAKMPSFYVGDAFVRLIPFNDHINIEASAVIQYKSELADYKITPKGMLQIYTSQTVPNDVLRKIFFATLRV